ncbi:MAG: heme A synthase, partial [Verrucomicrobiales bacterium]
FHRYAIFVVLVAVLLVWWGAAVTTHGVGMAVPDWPLSFGSVNPDGWWRIPALFLEHGHRLIASLVGLLTIILVLWAHLGGLPRAVRSLSLVALGMVLLQGTFGGIRVLHISDLMGVFHGCLGQIFFCLLIFLAMRSSPSWNTSRERLEPAVAVGARRFSSALVTVVFFQLVLGAIMRHTHRFGIADDGILTTGGVFFPGFADFDLGILFSHKAWALVVFFTSLGAAGFARKRLTGNPGLRTHFVLLAVVVATQLGLGIGVIATAKSFWVTNFHVLTGLGILALALSLAVKCFAVDSKSELPG